MSEVPLLGVDADPVLLAVELEEREDLAKLAEPDDREVGLVREQQVRVHLQGASCFLIRLVQRATGQIANCICAEISP